MNKLFGRSAPKGSNEPEAETDTAATESDTATGQDESSARVETAHAADGENETAAEDHDGGETEAAQPASPEDSEADEGSESPAAGRRRFGVSQVVAYGVLPGLALLMALGAAFLKWQDWSVRNSQIARIESVAAARDSTIALLSYKPDSVEKDLDAARDRLTGTFKESYTKLTHDVVIPGAKEKRISAAATVAAAASVKATPAHATALLFVDQSTIVGNEAPTDTASSVRVTLDKINGRWLVSAFDPI
ncbi:hypothetical protein [Mycobacterium sp. E1747]|uniref:hypothetical protein n=1 Tax=Mycobacterium sp. E1747 TaxID=1834128 RepID=UPI0007FF3C73|nr:hypothetical protein [Mycobacterium sp. E1747]OBH11739.1 hypothetical protein A5695_18365 [Mycobacterium sp. E1747]